MQQQPQHRDLLIRNVSVEIHRVLEKTAKEHHRSKTQEALIVLINGLSVPVKPLRKPVAFEWKSDITTKFIQDAIEEDRD